MFRRQPIAGKLSADEIIQENCPLPHTVLDFQTALIVVDLQQGIIGFQSIHPIAEVIDRTRSLIEAFRRNELPVVLVNVAGVAPGRTEQPRRHQTLPEGWTASFLA